MRLLILVPEVAFAEALESLLAGMPQVSGVTTVTTLRGARSALMTADHDVLLLETETESYDAVDVVREFGAEHPGLRIVALSGADDDASAAASLLAAGALAWTRKSGGADELRSALDLVARGHGFLPPELLMPVISSIVVSENAVRDADVLVDALTPRERDVLSAMAEGLTRREIAERLFLSVNTVRTHVQHVLAKLNVHTALEAVALVMQVNRTQSRGVPGGRLGGPPEQRVMRTTQQMNDRLPCSEGRQEGARHGGRT